MSVTIGRTPLAFSLTLGLLLSQLLPFAVQASEEERVLRHAVYFSFKETATEEQINQVVEAFEELPSKIDEIVDFEWGPRVGGNDATAAFTHCFMLTFKDEAGRDAYLPHEDHKAFGAIVGPLLADVFVIDYWADASEPMDGRALRHAVFLKFKADATQEQIDVVTTTFAAMPSKIKTIKRFEWGTNNSPESHDDGFTHAFLVTFETQEALNAYVPHEVHDELVEKLGPVLEQARVLDFYVGEAK